MKRLLTILILIFTLQTPSQADDIRDFQIEGMSIGDSLLDFLSEEEIEKKINHNTSYWYPNKTFVSIGTMSESEKYKIYEDVGIIIKPNDKKYIIYALEGTFYFDDKIDKCYKKQKEIVKDLKEMFSNTGSINEYDVKYLGDKSGKSKIRSVDILFKDKSAVRVVCYDMSKELNDDNNPDALYAIINSSEFMIWLNENMRAP